MAYKSSYTGPQIDQAVGNALIKDTTTLSNDVNHIPASSVVKSALMHDLANIVATGTTNTTGAAIASGTYFYLNGTLVRAKADIAVNATFTNGTNYEAVTAGGLNELKSAMDSLYTGSATITNSAFTGSGIALFKKGNFVTFKVTLQSDNPNAQLYTLGTVPSGFHPMVGVQLDINQENTSGAKSFCVIRFDTDGNVYLTPSANSGTTYYRGAGCYIV